MAPQNKYPTAPAERDGQHLHANKALPRHNHAILTLGIVVAMGLLLSPDYLKVIISTFQFQ